MFFVFIEPDSKDTSNTFQAIISYISLFALHDATCTTNIIHQYFSEIHNDEASLLPPQQGLLYISLLLEHIDPSLVTQNLVISLL